MKKILILTLATFAMFAATAQTLKFRTDDTFKIAQFTDIHFKYRNPASDSALVMINEVLDSEKPDLVVFSGDIVTGEFEGWAQVLEPVQKRKIPFAVVLGNHDDEQKTSRKDILEYLEKQPFSLTKKGDYVLPITANGPHGTPEALIYMFDSNSYSTLRAVDGYGWLTFDQVQNYIDTSDKFRRTDDAPALPSLAYFHIALPEYTQAFENKVYPPFGQKNEAECSPKINTGMFAAMRIAGDVMGCFVGHDHVNDYMAYHYDIALCFGRFSGGKTTYGNLLNGSRITTLYKGVRKFDSHLRLRGGATEQYAQYPRHMDFVVAGKSHKSPLTASSLGLNNLDGVETLGRTSETYTGNGLASGNHKKSGSYSWNLNGIHFIRYNHTDSESMKWFAADLKKNQNQQIILIYDQQSSVGPDVKDQIVQSIQKNNILAIFTGTLQAAQSKYKTYNISENSAYHIGYDKISGLTVEEVKGK